MALRIEYPSVQVYQLLRIVEQEIQILESLRVPKTLRHISRPRILGTSHVSDARIPIFHFGVVFKTLWIIEKFLFSLSRRETRVGMIFLDYEDKKHFVARDNTCLEYLPAPVLISFISRQIPHVKKALDKFRSQKIVRVVRLDVHVQLIVDLFLGFLFAKQIGG